MVSACDPQATEKARSVLPGVNYCADRYEAAESADAVLIVTEWDEFRDVDWKRLASVVEHPLIVDGRNMSNSEEVTWHGFHYVSIGRASRYPMKESTSDHRRREGPVGKREDD